MKMDTNSGLLETNFASFLPPTRNNSFEQSGGLPQYPAFLVKFSSYNSHVFYLILGLPWPDPGLTSMGNRLAQGCPYSVHPRHYWRRGPNQETLLHQELNENAPGFPRSLQQAMLLFHSLHRKLEEYSPTQSLHCVFTQGNNCCRRKWTALVASVQGNMGQLPTSLASVPHRQICKV